MARGRPLVVLTLEDRDRETLTRWTRRPKTAQALAQRARIVLAAADGQPNDTIARELWITPPTVGKWRRRFLERGPDGLLDEPRPGAPRTIGDERVEAVVVNTLESEPTDATHWSTRSMARRWGSARPRSAGSGGPSGSSPTGPRPSSSAPIRSSSRRSATSSGCTSIRPSGRSCCASTRRARSRPWRASSRSCRCSRAPPSGAATTTSGMARPACSPRSTRQRQGDRRVPSSTPGDRVPVVPRAHRRGGAGRPGDPRRPRQLRHPQDARDQALAAAPPALHLHFTPTGASWLNLVERWFAELTTKKIKRGAHRSVPSLEGDIRGWIATWNEDPRPYVWVKTADQILASLARYCEQISDSGD